MKYSILFGKTTKDDKADASTISQKLLYKAGFIRESTAGRYYFLPLGQRVFDKFTKIIDEEMQAAGSQKMFSPVLHPIELWKETNRNKSGGFELMSVTDRHGAQFALGGTAEEMFVDVVRRFHLTYKDLPINLYQMGYKFRDEIRARGGLLRVREFVMKDAYSFHTSEEDFKKEYQNMWDTYVRIYERVGLKTAVVPADNGYFGGEYCHEFIVESDIGESTYFVSEDGKYIAHEDIAAFKHEEINPNDELKKMEIIEQPQWVKTMAENEKHYKLPASRFLKNVVYKNRATGEIIIATIRGDLEVNKNKLEHVTNMVGLLDDATDEDLESIGTKSGYVHSWGYTDPRVKFVGDLSLRTVKNFIGGQKEDKTDSTNVNYGRDFEHPITADIAKAKAGFLALDGKSKLIEKRGIEVGNIFHFGEHYSRLMKDAKFVGKDGKEHYYHMGAYGLGVGRTIAAIIEVSHDEKGIIWPEAIAPFDIHLLSFAKSVDDKAHQEAEKLYKRLTAEGKDVLWDDRVEVTPGEKMKDADLIGIPTRMIVSEKSLEQGGVEVKGRREKEGRLITLDKVI